MASKRDYQLAAAIDSLLLWGRLGGNYAVVALIACGFVSLMDGIPEWVAPSILTVSLLLGAVALVRLWPFLSVRKHGIPIEGRITEVKERRVENNSDGGVSLKKRVSYSYEFDGIEYKGLTTWGSSGRFGTLGQGSPVPLIVNPKRPDRAVWLEDMPIQIPSLIGM
jgi:hypothetical protein